MKTIRVYQFYINSEYMGDAYYSDFLKEFSRRQIIHGDEYYLYGWCTTKSLRNLFKKSRSMDIFKSIVDEMNESEFSVFHSKFLDCSISKHDLLTKFRDRFPLAVTNFEMETVYSEYDTMYDDYIQGIRDISIYDIIYSIMNKELRKSLVLSGFREFMDILICDMHGEPLTVELDELNVILEYYGNTFIPDERVIE